MTKMEQVCVSLVVLICAALYAPVLAGQPIWDDIPVWFYDPALNHSYGEIFHSYTWPMTVAFQKFLFSIWGHQYNIYHAVNIGIHLLNAILLYAILSDLKIRGRVIVGLLFLFHPANVITISWMIQVKTLLSFFFAAVSVRLLILYHQNPFARVGAGASFLVSVLSKSGSVFMPVLMYLGPRKWEKRTLLLFGLALAISLAGILRILLSGDVHELGFSLEPLRADVMLRTMRYYFWQAFLPFNTVPVKDLDLSSGLWLDLLTCAGIIFLLYWFRNTLAGRALLVAQIFLLPFYGIIPAPYMNHTLVGDHHLYLVLPLYLIFITNIPVKREALRVFLVILILPFYSLKIHRSLPYYQSDETFYRSVLEVYPGSLSLGMNLAFYYVSRGEVDKALQVVRELEEEVDKEPRLRKHRYYEDFLTFKETLRTNAGDFKKRYEIFLRTGR